MTAERARQSFASFEKRLAVLRASDPSRVPACKRGCAHCCYPGNLEISRAEAAAIVEHVEASWSAADRAALRKRLEHAKSMPMMERWKARVPCPLLDEQDGTCTVYDVRPLRCRGWSSTDPIACEARDHTPIPCVMEQHQIAQEVTRELAPADVTELAAALLLLDGRT